MSWCLGSTLFGVADLECDGVTLNLCVMFIEAVPYGGTMRGKGAGYPHQVYIVSVISVCPLRVVCVLRQGGGKGKSD